jgi:hypothetical protein
MALSFKFNVNLIPQSLLTCCTSEKKTIFIRESEKSVYLLKQKQEQDPDIKFPHSF